MDATDATEAAAGSAAARRPRVLGVDVGTVRVGLAVSDPSRTLAFALETLEVAEGQGGEPVAELARRVALLAAEQECGLVVVGLPRSLSGRSTASTLHAQAVANALRGLGVVVELWDERLSSVEAERVLLAAGRRRAARRVERDRVAATIILQGWLDARKG
ncbi:MAG: Holliday junction resolvase RuvX [Egibacteraceae bacterium]